MIGPKMQISGRYGPHAPLGLGGERLRFVVGGSGHNDLVSMDVCGACCGSCKLRLFLCLLLDFSYLLPLLRGC